jgi:cell pole-organizing protein PopZ
MSEQAAQEPTMEEILASIRRIISEDDAPAEGQAAAPAAPEPAPVAEIAPEPPAVEPEPLAAMMDETPSVQAEDEVLELTEKVEEPAVMQSIGDLDVAPRYEAPPEPAPVAAAPEYVAPPAPSFTPSGAGGLTIEDLVRQILEPQIRAWADQNLEAIMRETVREKLDRVFK